MFAQPLTLLLWILKRRSALSQFVRLERHLVVQGGTARAQEIDIFRKLTKKNVGNIYKKQKRWLYLDDTSPQQSRVFSTANIKEI